MEKEIIKSNGIKWTKKDNVDRFLFPDEYLSFFKQLKIKQKHSVKVLLNTGARFNEAFNILVSDVDLERKRIVLRKTKSKARKGEKKGEGKPRIIPISTQFSIYLKKIIRQNGLNSDDKIGMISNPALNIAYKKSAIRAGLKNPRDISSHTFRKTLEVWLLSLGVDYLKLLAHFGHDVKTAARAYVSPDILSPEEKTLIRNIIGDLYQDRY